MTDPGPKSSFEEFKERARQLGHRLSEERARELYEGLAHVERLAAQVRRAFAFADEPAPVFHAGGAKR